MEIPEFKEIPTEPPPRKRLLTNPNPNPNLNRSFITQSLESTVSSDSSSDRLAKKTRELPNLSDCHSCGVRINFTNPRDRLQPLDSMWRIVLLCRKCSKRVSCCRLCTYCFKDVADVNDCFKCRDCERSVHKECVKRFGSELGFSLCVDCWIPDGIAKSIVFRKRKRKSNVFVEEMKREIVIGVKARDVGVKKPVVAKNSVELSKGVVESRKVAAGGEVKVVDDTELAFLLHRVMNSSPRILRYGCDVGSCRKDDAPIACYSRRGVGKKIVLMNSSSLDVPLICYTRRERKGCLRNSVSLNASLMCYSRRRSGSKACSRDMECGGFICKASERTDEHGSASSVGLNDCNPGSNSENSFSGNNCQVNDAGRKPHWNLLKYYRVGKGKPRPSVFVEDSSCCSCMDSANLYTEGMPDSRNHGNDNKSHEISESYDNNADRFLLKYKRHSRCKAKIIL